MKLVTLNVPTKSASLEEESEIQVHHNNKLAAYQLVLKMASACQNVCKMHVPGVREPRRPRGAVKVARVVVKLDLL